ncbi:MAG: ABC transporter permease [Solirubrobacterales bacterium]
MLAFLAKRLASGAVVLLLVSILIFAATNVLPGDPASAVLGRHASKQAVAALDSELGLDEPLYERYVDWLGGLFRGDLGNSAVQQAQGTETSVISLIATPLRNTLILAAVAAVILVPLSLLLGVATAVRAGKPSDQVVSVFTLATVSLPEFVVGSLLILFFFTTLDLFSPISLVAPGDTPLAHLDLLVLPVLTVVSTSLAWTTRLVRVGMLETLRSDYVSQARLNGISEGRVLRRYALRNALAPSVQVFAQAFQVLVGGLIVTEVVFSYPGLGTVLVSAVQTRDFPVVQATAIMIAATYLVLNIIADFIVVLLVPRLRTGQ